MPTMPRAVSSRARASSAPKRTLCSLLMTRAATFWPLKFPGSAAGFLQLETKDVEAHAAAATAAVTTRADLVDRSILRVPPGSRTVPAPDHHRRTVGQVQGLKR